MSFNKLPVANVVGADLRLLLECTSCKSSSEIVLKKVPQGRVPVKCKKCGNTFSISTEDRKAFRKNFSTLAVISRPTIANKLLKGSANTVDISSTGLKLSLSKKDFSALNLKVGDTAMVGFVIPNESRKIKIDVDVIIQNLKVTGDRIVCGVEFDNISLYAQQQINFFLLHG